MNHVGCIYKGQNIYGDIVIGRGSCTWQLCVYCCCQ